MNNRIQRGNVAELLVASEISKLGYVVCFPVSHNSHYDLVVDTGSKMIRVQIKRSYKVNSHGKNVSCVEGRRFSGGNSSRYPDNSYDTMIACDVDTNEFWIIPYSVASKYKAQIYLETEDKSRFKNDWTLL